MAKKITEILQFFQNIWPIFKNLEKNGIIICDNVLFKGMIANQELVIRRKITIVKRLRKFLKDIEENQDFISSIIPIGDGVLLSGRKEDE